MIDTYLIIRRTAEMLQDISHFSVTRERPACHPNFEKIGFYFSNNAKKSKIGNGTRNGLSLSFQQKIQLQRTNSAMERKRGQSFGFRDRFSGLKLGLTTCDF